MIVRWPTRRVPRLRRREPDLRGEADREAYIECTPRREWRHSLHDHRAVRFRTRR